jgi:hypothetical protein
MSQFQPYSAQQHDLPPVEEQRLQPLLVQDEAVSAPGFSSASLWPAIGGPLAAAIVGGIVWGLVIAKTDYEVGFLAWGLGFISGYAVLTFTGGARGTELQMIAAVGGVLGIVIGKYVAYVHFFQDFVRTQFGDEVATRVSYFDTQMVRFFLDDFTSLLSGFDIVWAVLAVVTAWRIPRLVRGSNGKFAL